MTSLQHIDDLSNPSGLPDRMEFFVEEHRLYASGSLAAADVSMRFAVARLVKLGFTVHSTRDETQSRTRFTAVRE